MLYAGWARHIQSGNAQGTTASHRPVLAPMPAITVVTRVTAKDFQAPPSHIKIFDFDGVLAVKEPPNVLAPSVPGSLPLPLPTSAEKHDDGNDACIDSVQAQWVGNTHAQKTYIPPLPLDFNFINKQAPNQTRRLTCVGEASGGTGVAAVSQPLPKGPESRKKTPPPTPTKAEKKGCVLTVLSPQLMLVQATGYTSGNGNAGSSENPTNPGNHAHYHGIAADAAKREVPVTVVMCTDTAKSVPPSFPLLLRTCADLHTYLGACSRHVAVFVTAAPM